MSYLKKNLTRLLCVFLFMLLVSLPFLVSAEAAVRSYDYSRPASSHNVTISSDALLSKYLGEELSSAEADYLRYFGDISVVYNDGITTDKIVREYSDGALTVTAYEYSYTSLFGDTLTWYPVSVSVGSQEVPLLHSGEGYVAEISGISEDTGLFALVTYSLELTVAKEDISSLLNRAYLDAPVWENTVNESVREYTEKLAEYNRDLAEYREYITLLDKYERDLSVYLTYLVEKKLYDERLLEYNEFVEAEAKYERELEAYNSYQSALDAYNAAYSEYLAYLGALSEYNSKLEAYNAQKAALETARAQLGFIDAAKVKMTMSRDVYSAIMGNLVTEVLVGNKDLLTSPAIGAKAEVIEAAETATKNLRILLPTYFELATEEEKYAYYSANYMHFRDNFELLAQALDELYRNRRIRNELKTQDRDEKYAILVAQLSLIAGALNGGDIDSYYGTEKLGGTYKIDYNGTKKTLSAILENKQYIASGAAPEPLAAGYPTVTEAPVAPPVKTAPIPPEAVSLPVKPQEVEHPGPAPDVITEPIAPSEKTEPKEPERYVPEPEITALIESYNSGELAQRPEASGDFTFNVYKTVPKKLFGVTEITVVFHGTDGEVLETLSVDSGTGVEFLGTPPTKAEDARAVYTFAGWSDSDGEVKSLTSVDEDLDLFPYFREDIKHYDVTFLTFGGETVKSFAYGTVPDYGSIPSRPDEGGYRFIFSGWDSPLMPVTGNASYSAIYSHEYTVPFGDSGATVTETDSDYIVDARNAGSEKIDLTYLIEKALTHRAVRGIMLDTSYGRVTLSYSTLLAMHGAGDTLISAEVIQLGAYGYEYRIRVYGKDGNEADTQYKLPVSMVCSLPSSVGNSMYCTLENGREGVAFTHTGSLVSFSALSGIQYTLLREYAVNFVPTDLASVTFSVTRAPKDATVLVDVTVTEGYKTVALRVIDANGTEIPVTGDSFVMPSSDVTVALEIAPIEYTVTFMDGTRVLSQATYKHGETPTPPTAPSKLGEGYYLYTFAGWSREVGPVLEDTVYYAVYTVTPIPETEEDGGIQISEGILRLIIAALIAAAMLFTVVIPSFLVNLCMYIGYRRRKMKKSE